MEGVTSMDIRVRLLSGCATEDVVSAQAVVLTVNPVDTIKSLQDTLLEQGVCKDPVELSLRGEVLRGYSRFLDLALDGPLDALPLYFMNKHVGIENGSLAFVSMKDEILRVSGLHVSCASERHEKGEQMVGMALWTYEGRDQWEVNGRRCQSGYVVVRRFDSIAKVESGSNQAHDRLYRSLFDEDPRGKVWATGFAFMDGEWRFNPRTFNYIRGGWQVQQENSFIDEGNLLEERLILLAYSGWLQSRRQTFLVSELEEDLDAED